MFIGLFSCTKNDYQKYYGDKETVYPAIPDSLQVHPGNMRIGLSWLILSDPNVTSYKVYWDNRSDSASQQIKRTGGVDTVNVLLTNMTPGTHSFEIFQYDKFNNRSVGTKVIGVVYGDSYQNTLLNRAVRYAEYYNRDSTIIGWYNAELGTVRTELQYTDINGQVNSVNIYPNQNQITLKNYDSSVAFTYRTVNLPEALGIDTFYSSSANRNLDPTPLLLSRNKTYSATQSNNLARAAFDGYVDVYHQWYTTKDRIPASITVDLQSQKDIAFLRTYFSYTDGAIYSYNIDGSNDGTLWFSMVPVGDYKSTVGQIPKFEHRIRGKYRYVRITMNAAPNGGYSTLAEFEVWGQD
jgi:hypothetical protein